MDMRIPEGESEATTGFGVLSEERAVSVTHAMTRLWLASSDPTGTEELQQAYDDCLNVIERSRPEEHAESRNEYMARVLRQLAADRDRLPAEFRAEMLSRLKRYILEDFYLSGHSVIRDWALQAFHDIEHGL
jgi:hypothetical protein